jgi:RimJ/RimL family protein N-acetyltransferase
MNYWQGKYIRLRAVEITDIDAITEWNLDSDLGRYLEFLWPPTSQASVKAFIEKETLKKLENDEYFWIIENDEKVAVGHINTKCDSRNGTFEYAISVASKYKRRGYASEAIWMVLQYYFQHLRYQKVTVRIHADNQPSIDLHKKLGYQLEGTVRRMIYTNGVYIDMLHFGMTKEEFLG